MGQLLNLRESAISLRFRDAFLQPTCCYSARGLEIYTINGNDLEVRRPSGVVLKGMTTARYPFSSPLYLCNVRLISPTTDKSTTKKSSPHVLLGGMERISL